MVQQRIRFKLKSILQLETDMVTCRSPSTVIKFPFLIDLKLYGLQGPSHSIDVICLVLIVDIIKEDTVTLI